MNIREESANYGQTFSSAVVLRARALESYRNVKKFLEEMEEAKKEVSLPELTGASDTLNKAMMNLNRAQRLLQLLLGQHPSKRDQILALSEKLIADMSEIVPYSNYVDSLHFHRMPITVNNPFAQSTKPFQSVRPSTDMTVHLSKPPETQPRQRDANFSDDYDQDYDESELRDDVETMLSGLGATLNHLGGPGLIFLQRQLAKLIEKL